MLFCPMPTSPTIHIRTAAESDLPALAAAHRASILEIAPEFYAPEIIAYWGRERPLEPYREAMRDKGETYFIAEGAEQPGHVLGFSSHRFRDDRHNLEGFYVRGTAARRGIGTRLLTAVEDFARARGATELHVEGALSAEAFYRARGFAERARLTHAMGPVTLDGFHMVKAL